MIILSPISWQRLSSRPIIKLCCVSRECSFLPQSSFALCLLHVQKSFIMCVCICAFIWMYMRRRSFALDTSLHPLIPIHLECTCGASRNRRVCFDWRRRMLHYAKVQSVTDEMNFVLSSLFSGFTINIISKSSWCGVVFPWCNSHTALAERVILFSSKRKISQIILSLISGSN